MRPHETIPGLVVYPLGDVPTDAELPDEFPWKLLVEFEPPANLCALPMMQSDDDNCLVALGVSMEAIMRFIQEELLGGLKIDRLQIADMNATLADRS